MKIEIENILSIKEAKIKIDGLTVIAGLNNSGKSTIGKSVFCVVKAIAMSKSGYFYKNRDKFILLKLNELKNIIKYFGTNKQQYDKLATKINNLEKEITKLNLEREQDKYLNILHKTKMDLFKSFKETKFLQSIFDELTNVITENFKLRFKNDVTNNILNYMFDKDFLKHNETNARILIEDSIIGKKF